MTLYQTRLIEKCKLNSCAFCTIKARASNCTSFDLEQQYYCANNRIRSVVLLSVSRRLSEDDTSLDTDSAGWISSVEGALDALELRSS